MYNGEEYDYDNDPAYKDIPKNYEDTYDEDKARSEAIVKDWDKFIIPTLKDKKKKKES